MVSLVSLLHLLQYPFAPVTLPDIVPECDCLPPQLGASPGRADGANVEFDKAPPPDVFRGGITVS